MSIRVEMDHDDGTHEDGGEVKIIANDIDIRVRAYEDGSVYIDGYAIDPVKNKVVVKHALLDAYRTDTPYIKIGLVKK